MFNKSIYILTTVLLVATSAIQAQVILSTANGNGADTYLSNDGQTGDFGPDSVHGADASLRAFRQLADTAAAEPLDETPAVRVRSFGLRTPTGIGLAKAVVVVLPRITAPARRNAVTQAESLAGRYPS